MVHVRRQSSPQSPPGVRPRRPEGGLQHHDAYRSAYGSTAVDPSIAIAIKFLPRARRLRLLCEVDGVPASPRVPDECPSACQPGWHDGAHLRGPAAACVGSLLSDSGLQKQRAFRAAMPPATSGLKGTHVVMMWAAVALVVLCAVCVSVVVLSWHWALVFFGNVAALGIVWYTRRARGMQRRELEVQISPMSGEPLRVRLQKKEQTQKEPSPDVETPAGSASDPGEVEDVDPENMCGICLGNIHDEMVTTCNHKFCKACLARHFQSNPARACPYCRCVQPVPARRGVFPLVTHPRFVSSR
jgi:hypothetical protein